MTYQTGASRIVACAALAAAAARAGQNDILVGLDEKTFFDADGMRFGPGGRTASSCST